MRLLVFGGRDFPFRNVVHHTLDAMHKRFVIDCIITGDATGADAFAREWGDINHVTVIRFRADWKRWGNAAGPIRNQRMLDEGRPDMAIAFVPGGSGTFDMKNRVKLAGLEYVQVHAENA